MDLIQGLVRGSPEFKEVCGAPMINVLVQSVCEAVRHGSADRGMLSFTADNASSGPAALCNTDDGMRFCRSELLTDCRVPGVLWSAVASTCDKVPEESAGSDPPFLAGSSAA